jgi:hypothetical protein
MFFVIPRQRQTYTLPLNHANVIWRQTTARYYFTTSDTTMGMAELKCGLGLTLCTTMIEWIRIYFFPYFYEIPIFYYLGKQKLITRSNYFSFTNLRNFVAVLQPRKLLWETTYCIINLFQKSPDVKSSGFACRCMANLAPLNNYDSNYWMYGQRT